MGSGRAMLEAELGGPLPNGLAGLEDDHLRDLGDAVAAAKRRQATEIAAAEDQALSHVPRLLRVAIRKMVG